MKCRCPSGTHGHKPGKCMELAVTSDQCCQPCHDKTKHEVTRVKATVPRKPVNEKKGRT
jgi:hypothetical protein